MIPATDVALSDAAGPLRRRLEACGWPSASSRRDGDHDDLAQSSGAMDAMDAEAAEAAAARVVRSRRR